MELKIQKKYLTGLGNWLSSLSLQGQESRNRTKFVEILSEDVKENEETRLEILKKYAKKDESGAPVIVKEEEQEHYDVSDEDMPALQKELIEFFNSESVFGGVGVKNRLSMVGEIVLNTNEKIPGQIAHEYDKWCEAFEGMKEEN